jgi:hypothetical protein
LSLIIINIEYLFFCNKLEFLLGVKMKKILALVIFMSASFFAQAMDTGNYYKITKIWSWGGYTNGVVLVVLENQHPLCPNGYWFQDSQNSGSKNLMAIALSAFHAKTPVLIYADENSDWSGLAAKECEIKLITMGG